MDSRVCICLVTMRQDVAKNGECNVLDDCPFIRIFLFSYSPTQFFCHLKGIPNERTAQIVSAQSTPRTKMSHGLVIRTQSAITSSQTSRAATVPTDETTQHGWVIFPLKSTTSFDEEWNAAPSTSQQRPTVRTKMPVSHNRAITGLAIKLAASIPPRHPSSTTTHFIQTSLPMHA